MIAALPTEMRTTRLWHFELGDHVHMTSTQRMPFEKGYAPKLTRERFVVRGCLPTAPPTYKLSDEMGEPIKSKFYVQELHSISPPDRYRIEKIIHSQRGRDGKVTLHLLVGYLKKI